MPTDKHGSKVVQCVQDWFPIGADPLTRNMMQVGLTAAQTLLAMLIVWCIQNAVKRVLCTPQIHVVHIAWEQRHRRQIKWILMRR